MAGALRPHLRGTAVEVVLRGITIKEVHPPVNGAVGHLTRDTVEVTVEVMAEVMAEVVGIVLVQVMEALAQGRVMVVVVDTTVAHPNRTAAAFLADTVPHSRRSYMHKSRRRRRRADLAVWVLL